MTTISNLELFQYYEETLNRCGLFLLKMDDEIISTSIYEDFDIGVHSFFHINCLERLHADGYISFKKMEMSSELRLKFIELQNNEEWDLKNFRTSKKWHQILLLADEIKEIG